MLSNPDVHRSDLVALHCRQALATATISTDPGPHMLIPDLMPEETYSYLLETMPPADAFEVADRVKANFDPVRAANVAERSRQAWLWFHEELVGRILTPLLLDAFRPYLESAYRAEFGPAHAKDVLGLDHRAFRGRLMLRRPGYQLKPHRDMKIAALTGLVYFGRPGDNREYGTDLFRIENDQQAPFMKTYYPEAYGGRAELVRSIPFVANTALIFMNVPGMAHGARIPREAEQTERYAYQFYVGPSKSSLAHIVRGLPPEQAATWSDLKLSDREY